MEKILETSAVCTFCNRRMEVGEKVWSEGEKVKDGPSITCALCFWGEKPPKESSELAQVEALRKEVADVVNADIQLQGEIDSLCQLTEGLSEEVRGLHIRITDAETETTRTSELAQGNRKIVKALFEMIKKLTREMAATKSPEEAGTLIDELIKIREESGI